VQHGDTEKGAPMSKNRTPRYLTKSRFKLAVECPTKLYYTRKQDTYADVKGDNEFLKALAEGGFQVGELAKLMFPGGIEVTTHDQAKQREETRRLLAKDSVTVFEGAIEVDGLFARVDVLTKSGPRVELIEVKSKSYDPAAVTVFRGKKGGIDGKMLPYLQDVAFQKHVFSLAYPALEVSCFLMMADKSKTCTVNGLNQRFKIRRKDDRPEVTVMPGTDATTIGESLLTRVNVDEYVDEILRDPLEAPGAKGPFAGLVREWADKYQRDERIAPVVGSQCAHCEFRTNDASAGLKDGRHECWQIAKGFTATDFAKGTVLDIWNFKRKQELIDNNVLSFEDVTREALNYKEGLNGLTYSQRQWMQVSGDWPGSNKDFYIDAGLVNTEMKKWKHPLHFIDFETSRVAIPFFIGQRPYENVAFQFSHHVVDEQGRVEHRTQFLETTPHRKPNYEFVRRLRAAVGDQGSVFMWTSHENTTLNAILDELEEDSGPPADVEELKAFILSLTVKKKDKKVLRAGARALIDLSDLAADAFFHPLTDAKFSIKAVLPAVLQSSRYLRERYSKPIYGLTGEIRSLNFPNRAWWSERDGRVEDPYRTLPPVFKDLPQAMLDDFGSDDESQISEGGAAMMAYARLQFEETDPAVRRSVEAALLRYCELDTLAMVMIYEAWREWSRR
jgi:hypothetical protein